MLELGAGLAAQHLHQIRHLLRVSDQPCSRLTASCFSESSRVEVRTDKALANSTQADFFRRR